MNIAMTDFLSKENDGYVVLTSPQQHYDVSRGSKSRMSKFLSTGHFINHSIKSNAVIGKTTKQSNRLPKWMLCITYKMLGIKSYTDEKPTVATFLFVITLISAFTFFITDTWYKIYKVLSNKNDYDVVQASMDILTVLLSCVLGCYSHDLAFKLLKNTALVKDIRQHSKKFFKINFIHLSTVLLLAMAGMRIYRYITLATDGACEEINVHFLICRFKKISNVVFSCAYFLWVMFVLAIMMSVCRTHTIAVRRFMKHLKKDAVFAEREYFNQSDVHQSIPIPGEVYDGEFEKYDQADDDDDDEESETEHDNFQTRKRSVHFPNYEESGPPEPILYSVSRDYTSQNSTLVTDDSMEKIKDSRMLTSDEILHEYWKFSGRFRMISEAFQRWMASYIIILLLSSSKLILYWMDHVAEVEEIFIFAILVLLLPIICSSFADVNAESTRVVNCIYPVKERLSVIGFIGSHPFRLTVHGLPVTYGNITAALFAVGLAVMSRLVVAKFKNVSQSS